MNLGCATLGPRFGPAFHPKSVTNTLRDTKPRQSGANDWDVEPIYSECIATLGERRPTCAWSGRACAHRSSAISLELTCSFSHLRAVGSSRPGFKLASPLKPSPYQWRGTSDSTLTISPFRSETRRWRPGCSRTVSWLRRLTSESRVFPT